jgi:hypothetical protein
MARLESESKGGFYPTPPEEMASILKRLRVEEGSPISILDPCCGKAHVLKQIQSDLLNKGAQATTYGIEIEKTRAEEAKQFADHLIACGYVEARLSHGAFSFLYLNPPFMELGKERAETIFFRDLTAPDGYIPVGGLVIFNLPQYVLANVAKLMAIRLRDVKVYRFSDANYDAYKQVIVFGYRKAPGGGRDEALQEYLELVAQSGKDFLPTLDSPDEDEVFYLVPSQKKPVDLFQSMVVEPEDILQSLMESKFFSKVLQRTEDGKLDISKAKNPAMPLKISHFATAIAAGALPEHMGSHLLVGVTKRIQIERTDIDEESGKIKDSVTYKPKSMVRIFAQDGIFNLE